MKALVLLLLASALSDLAAPDYETREAAYRSLLEEGGKDPDRVLALLPEHSDDMEAQSRVEELREALRHVRLLNRMGLRDPPVRDLAEAFLESPSDASLIALLQKLGKGPEAACALAPLLEHPDPIVRAASAGQLGLLPDPALAPLLHPLLSDGDPGVRRTAAQSLRFLGNPASIPPLLKRALDERETREVRATAFYALGRLRSREALPLLLDCLKAGDLRKEAAGALGMLGAPEGIDALAALLDDPVEEMRFTAALSLERVAGEIWAEEKNLEAEKGKLIASARLWAERRRKKQRPTDPSP